MRAGARDTKRVSRAPTRQYEGVRQTDTLDVLVQSGGDAAGVPQGEHPAQVGQDEERLTVLTGEGADGVSPVGEGDHGGS